jgi:hypothetical protein
VPKPLPKFFMVSVTMMRETYLTFVRELAGHTETNRSSMPHRELLAVHAVSEESLRMPGCVLAGLVFGEQVKTIWQPPSRCQVQNTGQTEPSRQTLASRSANGRGRDDHR